MSSRAGWRIDGKHFTETRTDRGGLRHFIDGKPTRKSEWLRAMAEHKKQESAFIRNCAMKSTEPVSEGE